MKLLYLELCAFERSIDPIMSYECTVKVVFGLDGVMTAVVERT
jgi:hypothetical protein